MTAGEQEPPGDPNKRYGRDDSGQIPKEAIRIFNDVANNYEKSQTVVWKSAVSSLQAVNDYLEVSKDARLFMNQYMHHIIGILVEQEPSKTGSMERGCVEESLDICASIIAKDLRIQLMAGAQPGECKVLNVLACMFNKKKKYYKGSKSTWNAHSSGLPEVRLKLIEKFRLERGFWYLAEYLSKCVNTPQFPPLDVLHHTLMAIVDALPDPNSPNRNKSLGLKQMMEKDGIRVAKAVLDFISNCSEDQLKKLPHDELNVVRGDLNMIFELIMTTNRKESNIFYGYWRALTLKLITSQSLPLKIFGWDQVNFLIETAAFHRPPAKRFHATGAGRAFANGAYEFDGTVTPDGYAVLDKEVTYVRKVPDTEKEGAGKTLTLFRCTMRSQQKWWFLSEADKEQPGTDRDIDYYQHKSKAHEEREPPPDNWITCRNAGLDPPPTLRREGLVVPPGEEYNTLEHQLARWATENGIVELVLGDSLHREIVARSTPLIKFLASMCERDVPIEGFEGSVKPNSYCLQDSHLLLAWKTCTNKADAAVSTEIYQLLVSILPSLSSGMAVTLLSAVQMSLRASTEKRDYLPEVAEFCSALAASTPVDKTGQVLGLQGVSDDVRKEIIHLMWALLTHPDASSLKSYDHLKRYVANELRLEPAGAEHRKFFLNSCTERLSRNVERKPGNGVVDELHVLRAVKLTQFVLQACPREQTVMFVTERDGALPLLLFNELIAYMGRRNADLTMSPAQKRTGAGEVKHDVVAALSERLEILRYVYGISEQVKLNIGQLQRLWQLCSIPSDREALMMFIADASGSEPSPNTPGPAVVEPQPMQVHKPQPKIPTEPIVAAAFPDDVRTSAFLDLFCSTSVNWGELEEGAYRSFQLMLKKLRQSPEAAMATSAPSLDTLWRICLNAGNDAVASEAMNDLLAVYTAMANASRSQNAWADERMSPTGSDSMTIDAAGEDSFGNRVFQCLVEVKKGLEAGTASSERSAERCLRILNAAVSHDGSNGRSVSSLALDSLASVSSVENLQSALAGLPHGMRGQSGYRRISVMAKRTPSLAPNMNMGGPVALTPPAVNESVNASGHKSSASRFTIYVHPLETLASIKEKVAQHCQCPVTSVKTVSVNGSRGASNSSRSQGNDSSQLNLNIAADDSIVDQLRIVHGCELIVMIQDKQTAIPSSAPNPNKSTDTVSSLNVSEIFTGGGDFAHRLFETLLGVLELLPWRETENNLQVVDSHKLVWDLLLAIPTNRGIMEKVHNTARADMTAGRGDSDAMVLDSPQEKWSDLLDRASFHHSVYVMQVIESLLQPAPEALSVLPADTRADCVAAVTEAAGLFRIAFIESGGFNAVVRWFSAAPVNRTQKQSERRMGNAVALRILKCCVFGSLPVVPEATLSEADLDEIGQELLQSLSGTRGLLKSLTSMVVLDDGIASATILDVLRFLWLLLFYAKENAHEFVNLPDSLADKFLVALLLWEGGPDSFRANAMFGNAARIREEIRDLILRIYLLSDHALPVLIRALNEIDVTSDATAEYFDVMRRLVETEDPNRSKASDRDLQALGTAVCKKLLSCPRPTNDGALTDFSTGVLCGCLQLLRAIIESGGSSALKTGTNILLSDLDIARWSEQAGSQSPGVLQRVSSSFRGLSLPDDATLIDLMGALFDGFLSPGGSSSVVAICCDQESRSLGFNAVATAARACQGHDGYVALVNRITGIVKSAEPHLRHRWNQNGGTNDGHSRSMRNTAKYSGLRNQGCTCYMNSFLQQMFMMPELRGRICSAPLPASLRTSGGTFAKGTELVGKKISLQWDSGVSHEAVVEGFDAATGMHTIRYAPIPVATVAGAGHQQLRPEEVGRMPPPLQDEFFLSEGRPGKETGVFEIVEVSTAAGEGTSEQSMTDDQSAKSVAETEDESSSRHLLEEVQRTFIHLDVGSRGRCFDPRALVEACGCLKLEFDVWQQNDASEFAMKLLDRMEIALKKWAPDQFRYLDHTFGLKQTKQKVCKECGLKTNREENLMNIDCQIRGKSDIHEALSTMCEVELMEGNNKVFCDNCKKKTDTVLKTAISALPDMLILSLKRFDLDYNTFETVKLNSRCEFGQTLNMKRYTLEGIEALEKAGVESENADATPMETDDEENPPVDPLSSLPDDDYEYRLAGVLVHAGVAQGGHYYSFIKDRTPGADADKWYRFDDEVVTPFDPSSIEDECFGGVIAKDKWAHSAVQPQERFANALMLFYEKVKPAKKPEDPSEETQKAEDAMTMTIVKTTGYEVFTPDVRRSNATHRWQTFLFDAEFQEFLKGLLHLCQRSRASDEAPVETGSMRHMTDCSWQGDILDMLYSFFFDVLLYSAQRSSVNDWVDMLSDIFMADGETAKRFVRSLAERTQAVSSNWLKTYISDCPEHEARIAAIRVFNAGIQACAAYSDEQDSLRKWSTAWKKQGQDVPAGRPFPTRLEGRYQELESLASSKASKIGIILSYLACLIEVAPRTWRYNTDLGLLIRDLSNARPEYGGIFLREAMEASEFPGRLISLVLRDHAPAILRAAFPGATVSFAAADSQVRAETNPAAHISPMASGHQLGAPDRGSRHAVAGQHQPSSTDYRTLMEALACLIGVKGAVHGTLIVEAEDTSRGRERFVLSKPFQAALETIFEESCTNPAGMGHRDIDKYLQRCGVDRATISPQKISDMMSKYSSHSRNISKHNLLDCDGFLSYYKDTAQTQDTKVRLDLHTFGYRPDLSRRSPEARLNKDVPRPILESVAMDVVEREKESPFEDERPSDLTLAGLISFTFFAHAFNSSEPLAEYILAKCVLCWSDIIPELIASALRNVYRYSERWSGAEQTWAAARMIFRTLVSIPDKHQEQRIRMIMICDEKISSNSDCGIGLLEAPREVQASGRRYNQDIRYAMECYIDTIKWLGSMSQAVERWFQSNRNYVAWLDPVRSREDFGGRQQARVVEYSRRDDSHGTAFETYAQSDSDMHHQDSDEEEDDYDESFNNLGREVATVQGAAVDVVNGNYQYQGVFDGAAKYTKVGGVWQNQAHEFSLFRCSTSNGNRYWYISIVPQDVQPGTSTDIDFYSAQVSLEDPEYPPATGWSPSSEGKAPAPTVTVHGRISTEIESRDFENQPWPDDNDTQHLV